MATLFNNTATPAAPTEFELFLRESIKGLKKEIKISGAHIQRIEAIPDEFFKAISQAFIFTQPNGYEEALASKREDLQRHRNAITNHSLRIATLEKILTSSPISKAEQDLLLQMPIFNEKNEIKNYDLISDHTFTLAS